MANFFRIDADGTKRGPFTGQQIQKLVQQGHISPDTPIETDAGDTMTARQVRPDQQSTTTSPSGTSSSGSSDIGFVHFLTPALIAIIWWLTILLMFVSLIVLMSQIGDNPGIVLIGLGAMIISLLYTRIILESIAIFFRMERHQRTIKEILERNEKAAKP